jgi:hypothetical protein
MAAQNPDYTANPFIAGLSPAIYMLVFGGVNATQVRRDWIESFFRKSIFLFSFPFVVITEARLKNQLVTYMPHG